MSSLSAVLSEFASDVDAVFLFSPSRGFYESFEEIENLVVVAPENAVDAPEFVELPLEFDNVRDRIRFGIEGAMGSEIVDEGDTAACIASVFR